MCLLAVLTVSLGVLDLNCHGIVPVCGMVGEILHIYLVVSVTVLLLYYVACVCVVRRHMTSISRFSTKVVFLTPSVWHN